MQPTLNNSGIRYSFKVGDMAVHPAHGVGEVERLEDRDFGGRMTTVYVIKIRDMDPENMVSRELALMKVSADARTRSEVIQLVEIFDARIIDVTPESLTIQVTGESDELLNFEQLLRPFGLIELVKTGVVALGRGSSAT